MKRLLLITYTFPPFLTPESLLVTRAVRALSECGWNVTVLTIKETDCLDSVDYELMRLVPLSVEIVRAPSFERRLYSHKRIWDFFSQIFSTFGLPENQLLWCFGAVLKGLQLLKQKRFDAIHSWASYHTSNVVGLLLKLLSGVPWISHFSDPWIDNPYSQNLFTPRQSRVILALEKAIINKSDAVVLTTVQTVDLMMSKYPISWRSKVSVIPHGYDVELLSNLTPNSFEPRRFRLIYTGNLYGKRSSRGLLQALNILAKTGQFKKDELEVRFIGHVAQDDRQLANDLRLNDLVVFQDQVPYMQSLQIAAAADVLLLVDAPSSTPSPFLPSKLVDYLMFKKPILGLTPKEGASADLLRQLECPVVSPDDVPSIVMALCNLLNAWRSEDLSISPRFEQVSSSYTIDETGRLLDQLLADVIARRT